MRHWDNDKADYKWPVVEGQAEMRVWVKGALSEDARPKVVLEEHSLNEGPSLRDEEARSKLIEGIAEQWGKKPRDVDWYMLEQNGELSSLDPHRAKVTREDPRYTDIKEDTGLSAREGELEKAHKLYPDITEEKGFSPQRSLTQAQSQELKEAFRGWERESSNSQETEKGQDKLSGHEYDLEKERM